GRWSPLRLLQARQQATRLSQLESPPRERGTTWSSVSSVGGNTLPQYWQVLWSRRRMFLRDRLLRSKGMWMYSTRRMTDGVGIEKRDECSQWCDEHSSAWATPFKMSTTARRTVQTLIGSN